MYPTVHKYVNKGVNCRYNSSHLVFITHRMVFTYRNIHKAGVLLLWPSYTATFLRKPDSVHIRPFVRLFSARVRPIIDYK